MINVIHWRYGLNCGNLCACIQRNTESCDKVTGVCRCKPGFTGDLCEYQCPLGYYGHKCSNRCNCYNNASCDAVSLKQFILSPDSSVGRALDFWLKGCLFKYIIESINPRMKGQSFWNISIVSSPCAVYPLKINVVINRYIHHYIYPYILCYFRVKKKNSWFQLQLVAHSGNVLTKHAEPGK